MSDFRIYSGGGITSLQYGSQLLPVKHFKANINAGTTDGAVITAVPGYVLLIVSFRVMAGSVATDATFNSKPGGSGTAISEKFACGANGGQMGPFQPVGHFKTSAGEGLSLTTGAGSAVGVGGAYVEVPA